MRSTEFYRMARASWGPLVTDHGFRRVPKTSASWAEAHDGHHLSLALFVDHHGWDRLHGSSFEVLFSVSAKAHVLDASPDERGWFGERLDPATQHELLARTNTLVSGLGRPTPVEVGLDREEYERYLRHFFEPSPTSRGPT